jgi:hypothetical protein
MQEVHARTDMMLVSHHPDPTKSRGQYMEMLEAAVKEDASDPSHYFYYARELTFYKRWTEAREALTHYLGMNGAMQMVSEEDFEFDHWLVAAGTGTTAAGLLVQSKPHQKVWIYSALKGENYITGKEIADSPNVGQQMDYSIVRKAMESLQDKCRNILIMFYFDGFDMKTIAAANGLASASVAKAKKHQCLKGLEGIIKQNYSASDFYLNTES